MAMGAEMVGRKGDFPLRVLRAPGGHKIIKGLQVLTAFKDTFSFDIYVLMFAYLQYSFGCITSNLPFQHKAIPLCIFYHS